MHIFPEFSKNEKVLRLRNTANLSLAKIIQATFLQTAFLVANSHLVVVLIEKCGEKVYDQIFKNIAGFTNNSRFSDICLFSTAIANC